MYQKNPNALLLLSSGEYFLGILDNITHPSIGTLCFNTAMTGYQEAISDPSYAGQILVFTYPHIGNVGVNLADREADTIYLQGIVCGDAIDNASNYRSEMALDAWLLEHNIPVIYGIDTRTLVKIIRNTRQSIQAMIAPLLNISLLTRIEQLMVLFKSNIKHSINLSTKKIYEWLEPPSKLSNFTIIVIDYGVKFSILRLLKSFSCRVLVFPADSSFQEIISYHPDGIVLSNGPGDPQSIDGSLLFPIKQAIALNIPLLGICLGYQLLARIYGATLTLLSCGHHGINHPVQNLFTKKTFITSHNHEFIVDETNLPSELIPTYRSLFDNSLEGFKVNNKPILAVQFHPEAAPGSNDAIFIFQEFFNLILACQNVKIYIPF